MEEEKHVISMPRELEERMELRMMEFAAPETASGDVPTIYKVPPSIRHGHEDAYDPKCISIGPLHRHGSEEVRQMERLKWRYLQDLIQRSPEANSIRTYVGAVRPLEDRARRQYSVEVKLSPDEFVETLVLDGCFVLEFLLKRATGSVGSPWKDAKWNLPFLRHDLLLLENQIPFFIIQVLFDHTGNIPRPAPADAAARPPLTLTDFALHYLAKGKVTAADIESSSPILHLLHLHHLCQVMPVSPNPNPDPSPNPERDRTRHLRRYVFRRLTAAIFFVISLLLMCKRPRRVSKKERAQTAPRAIPSARRLKEAGVRFKRKRQQEEEEEEEEEKRRDCYLDLSFTEDGELEMPFLSVQQSSISIFRNLIAFEQCCNQANGQYFTAYAMFMDQIIDTPEDVGILTKYRIIESKLGSDEEVATLFNGICKGASLNYEKQYLRDVFVRVNAHCESDRNRWRAELVQGYFHNPWAVASIIVATLVLVFTGIQAVCSIVQGK